MTKSAGAGALLAWTVATVARVARVVMVVTVVTGCSVGEDLEDEIPELGEDQDPVDADSEVGLVNCNVQPAFATQGTPVTVGGHAAWAHFTDPGDPAAKTNITDEVARLIWSVPPGETIHAAIKSISLASISTALTCAADRGVNVRIVAEGGIATPRGEMSKAARQLEAAAQKYGAERFRLTFCGAGTDKRWACIEKDRKAIMHTKLFLFSKATAPDGVARADVVWFGSANMTAATGQNSFNNTVTIYGDASLYGSARQYYRDLQSKRTVADGDYFGDRGVIVAPSARLFVSPSPAKDLWLERLERVTPGGDCAIVVAQAYILESRIAVVRQLRRLANDGCTVKVIGPRKDDPTEQEKKFNASMLDILNGNPAAGIPRIETRRAKVHDKYMIINARFGGSATRQQLVLTGSHNLTGPANNRNDELLVRLDGEAIAGAYFGHWLRAWAAGTPAN